ncbi:ribosome biogenesis factor YjgA [Coralloluteibacterium thermophilus]|uniref:Dual-action ribosomal maturation protein DarP n=1 Tax=Coralloluteibacterium thermophilum TaxID=2707049 RepID=A0ABV9NN30_9GAMM
MRGIDEETGEYLSPSRSQNRREALAVFELGERLVALSDSQLAQLPVPPDLLGVIQHTRRIKAPIAHKRELQYLAKQLRREDEETLDALRAALDHDKAQTARETAFLHRVEAWRERLLTEGDGGLGALVEAHPAADRQQLRTLVRNALAERAKNKPPHAYRELFRALRDLLDEAEREAD